MTLANQAATVNSEDSGFHTIRNENGQLPDQIAIKELLIEQGIPAVPAMLKLRPAGDVAQFVRNLASLDQFALKSARCHSMAGTLVISGRQENVYRSNRGELFTEEMLTQHIFNIVTGEYALGRAEIAFAEPVLTPDEFFSAFYPAGLSDVYIDYHQGQNTRSTIILPTLASEGRPRLYLGAIALAVRPDTGITWHASQGGEDIECHPENGLGLVNIAVPRWAEIMMIANKVSALLPLGDLRVRIAIDKHRGPLVLTVSR